MKTILKWVVGALLVISMFGVPVLAADDVIVELDGERVSFPDQQPIIKNSRVLVPIGKILEQLGYSVSWDHDTQTATFTNGVNTVVIKRWSPSYTVNGKTYKLNAPADTVGDRMMVEFMGILSNAGHSSNWDSNKNTVIVSSAGGSMTSTANNTSSSSDYEKVASMSVEALSDKAPDVEFKTPTNKNQLIGEWRRDSTGTMYGSSTTYTFLENDTYFIKGWAIVTASETEYTNISGSYILNNGTLYLTPTNPPFSSPSQGQIQISLDGKKLKIGYQIYEKQ